ncbi:MAG: hypothetical protein KF732_12670 [Flavobacteriales bacterium]|nr:hypothetical protein [Flavobacteriales bacterium]
MKKNIIFLLISVSAALSSYAQKNNHTVFKELKAGTSAKVTVDVAKYDATTILNLENELTAYFQKMSSSVVSSNRANELVIATTKKNITISYNDEIPVQDLISTFKKHGVSCRPKK